MAVSVSINTTHISYRQTYTIYYECTYTPFRVYLSIKVNGTVTWSLKNLAENLVSTYGSLDFSLTPEEIAQDMTNQGYPPGTNTVTGIQVSVVPDDIGEVLNGNYAETEYIPIDQPYTVCREPTSPKLSATLSRDAVKLSWGAGSAGTNNSVTGYDVQRRESTDGNNWGSWENVPGSPVTTTEMNVSPPNTAGNYYQYQVRTRGSAGSNYYSGWVTGTTGETTLRRDHDTLAGFTDDPLTAGTSLVKALHIQELQSRVSTLRTFYGLGTYNFATITAGTTSLAGWTTHVNQIRTAIEDVCNASGKAHESWISFSVNCPRADVIQQLRRVILAL